jgi:anti-sigma factor RsiW
MAAPLACDQCEVLLPGYLLAALEAAQAAAVAEHLHTCDRCQASLVTYEAVLARLAQAVPQHEPPPDIQQRLMAAVTGTPPPAARASEHAQAPAVPAPERLPARSAPSRPPGGRGRRTATSPVWHWPSFVAALSLAAVVTWALTYFLTRSTAAEYLTEAAVSAHMRSVMANHLTDIASADPQSVEAWLKDRLPFVLPVRDLRAQGYTLEGGRLDYLYKHPVAALVYRHGDHLLTVFVWPTSRRDNFSVHRLLRDEGFHSMLWTRSGTNYCAISDLGRRDFLAFVHSYGS